MTLGEIINVLQTHPCEQSIIFDFGGLVPTTLDSYRGYYDQLALGYKNSNSAKMTVGYLLQICQHAVGQIFQGWKGGSFLMSTTTTVWVANRGECAGTAISRIEDLGWITIIHTVYDGS